MLRFKRPRATFMEHLTHDNYYLNERCKDLTKTNELLTSNISFLNSFFVSNYDLSGNYLPNIKIVSYDSSYNIISYICSDESGNFLSNLKLDDYIRDFSTNVIKNILNVEDNQRGVNNKDPPLKNTMINTSNHIVDSSRCYVNPYFYPYYYPFPYPDYLNPYFHYDNDDYRGIDLSLNHPYLVSHTTTRINDSRKDIDKRIADLIERSPFNLLKIFKFSF